MDSLLVCILASLLSLATSKPYDITKLRTRSAAGSPGSPRTRRHDQPLHTRLGLGAKGSNQCETVPFYVTIAPLGCDPVQYENNYCTGFCTSFYVPGMPRTARSESCNVCKPAEMVWTEITLYCLEQQGNRMVKVPKLHTVRIVNKCKCGSCHRND